MVFRSRFFSLLLRFICIMIAGAWLNIPYAAVQANQAMNTTAMIWPISGSDVPDTASISSPFGPRWQGAQSRYDYHPGLDISVAKNTPVHAVLDGAVYSAGWQSDESGNTVILYHAEQKIYSAYMHLNSISVVKGQAVTQGQVIGTSGNSGNTEFYHLHFEIRVEANNWPNSTRNPMGYLPHPDTGAPSIQISTIQAVPIYSPVVTLLIKIPREELDLNQVRVILTDSSTDAVLDDQMVDFNKRLHTGGDSLNQDGIQLTPTYYNISSPDYQLTATFNTLRGFDAFKITAQAVDVAGNVRTASAIVPDTTPPGKVTSLYAVSRPDGGVDLSWTSPGDSGAVGTAASYEIRYAAKPVDSSVWDNSAKALSNPPPPVKGGQMQTWSVPGPFSGPVFFALRSTDIEGNRSAISNSALAARFHGFLPVVRR